MITIIFQKYLKSRGDEPGAVPEAFLKIKDTVVFLYVKEKATVSFFCVQIPGKKESTKKNQKIKPKKRHKKCGKQYLKKTQKSEKYHLKIKYTFQKILPMPEQADP